MPIPLADLHNQVTEYYDNLEERPVVSSVEPGYLRKLIPDEAPTNGEKWNDIQKDIEDKIMPGLTHWQSPRYMAWFPAASTYPGILGEMYSATFNSANFNWICSPGKFTSFRICLPVLHVMLGSHSPSRIFFLFVCPYLANHLQL